MTMSTPAPDYGQAFARWRAACPGPWADYTRHAFVRGLADGSLPRAAFLNYLRQDYLFLIHFSRAWSLAVVKAGTLEEMQIASSTVHLILHEEMALHVGLCAEAGISQAELLATVEAPENMAYTRYVLEAGFSGDFLDLLAALAPCVFGYGEIGARLLPEAVDTPYRSWIETYASDEFQQACRDIGALMDGAIARRLGPDAASLPRWKDLEAKFEAATRLEAGFWGLGRA